LRPLLRVLALEPREHLTDGFVEHRASGARIVLDGDALGLSGELLDDGVTVGLPDDLLDVGDLVAVRDQEVSGVAADLLVLGERQAHRSRAFVVPALAEKVGRGVAGERFVDLLDALVHATEERFVLRDPLLSRIHQEPILRNFDADETILDDDLEDVHRKIGG
jgi:hypothetical protein